MKKAFAFLLLCCLTLSFLCVSNGASVAALAEGEEVVLSSPYDLAAAYAAAYPHRDVASGGEQLAAQYLFTTLASYGFEVATPAFSVNVEQSDGSKKKCDYYHVVGKKDNGKKKTLLIGCYYGGYAPTDNLGAGEGASAALSVGLTLAVAKVLFSAPLDYDLAIAFWGGVEADDDLHPSYCGVALKDIALYLNFDCVAAGKNDYLYADDLPRSQEKYFRTVAKEQGVTLYAAPAYKKQSALTMGEGVYSYMHLGLLGANRCFLNEGVPCLSFIGGAWDHDSGLYRYPGNGEIEGSSLDTFKQINELNGAEEVTKGRLEGVAKVVIAGLTDDRLPAVLNKAASETTGADLHSDLAYYLIVFIGLAAVVVFFAVLILKQKKDRRDVVWEERNGAKNPSENPYEEFMQESPFPSEETDDPSRNDGDGDDIFRF